MISSTTPTRPPPVDDPWWIQTTSDRLAWEQGCRPNITKAARVIEFFEQFLRHGVGQFAGRPFIPLPWQRDFLWRLFGWLRPDGSRRFRDAELWVPKKNGKTELGAGIALYLLRADGEEGPRVYSTATTHDQAALVYMAAASMARKSEKLSKELKCLNNTKRIIYAERNGFYQALSADAPGHHGLNANGVISDELHAHKSRELWDVMRDATAARVQPLSVVTSTAGFDRESIGWERYSYACAIRDSTAQDITVLPCIYEAAQTDDWQDPAVWQKANPSWGVTINAEQFAERAAQAKQTPAAENQFRQLRLNQWTQQAVRWIQMDRWDALPVNDVDLKRKECWGGLDLASTLDTTSLVLCFRLGDGAYKLLPFFFVPEDADTSRERHSKQRYRQWIKSGHMIATPGESCDYAFVFDFIGQLRKEYRIKEIAVDRWNSTQLQQQLTDAKLPVVQFGQGFASMSAPSKELERLIIEGKLDHGGHPVLRWMAGNVAAKMDPAGNIKPDKAASTEKIDGIVAAIMALDRAMRAPKLGTPRLQWA